MTAPDLPAVLAHVAARATGSAARDALDVAARYLAGDATTAELSAAAEHLRAAYERVAPPLGEGVRRTRETHADRWRCPWTDPCVDPPALLPLAACVAAVYAVEAAATGERASRVGYYQRAAEGWL